MWRARLVRKFNLSEQVAEILDEVSIISYIQGTVDITLKSLKEMEEYELRRVIHSARMDGHQ